MNLPNVLSLIRVLLVPVMVGLCSWPAVGGWGPGIAFALASLTDFFDGRIARSRNQVTDLGKFLDPLADKLLVLSAMVMLVRSGQLPGWVCCLVLARELAVDGLRMVAVGRGKVIAASPLGKLKTTCQMALILVLFFLDRTVSLSDPLPLCLCALATALTVWSGVDYFVRNRDALKGK